MKIISKTNISMLLLLVCGLFYINTAIAKNELRIVYDKPLNSEEKAIKKALKKSGDIESIIELINENLRLAQPIKLIIGGDDGPLYDGESSEIFIPYDFVAEVKERFRQDNYAETGVSINDATLDVVMHTAVHEIAHALIDQLNIPVLGKEEDAADGLATWLLIEFFEQGQEIVISAADLFDLESTDVKKFDAQDFWGEHSLDSQRYYSALCHVYGSDPKRYKNIAKDAKFSADRADLCIDEYEQLDASWMKVLKPYLKK